MALSVVASLPSENSKQTTEPVPGSVTPETASDGTPGPASAPTTAAPRAMVAPAQWPPEVVKLFDPVRVLGVGGFASVVLARKKDISPEELVAMKVAGTKEASRAEKGYARREIDILSELQHPNIMKLINFWEPPPDSKTCAAVMALSYAKGPTLENLIKHGGALSVVFGRVTAAQLCDAVAYLHSRAVIHRDIKPDNVVVSGASAKQDVIWEDSKNEPNPDFKALCQKWRVTLVDFGFARALSPDDLEKEKVAFKPPSLAVEDSSQHSTRDMDRSISRSFQRSMSALGNRLYAAPEIINGVEDNNSDRLKISRHYTEITNTFSGHVSNYGMLADAYSLGNTMKYMMTGVPPNENIDDFIRSQNSPLTKLCRLMCKPKPSTGAGLQSRDIQYRRLRDLPAEFQLLIKGTTHPRVTQRISVRAARRYPFFDDILEESAFDISSQTIHFLHCTLKDTTSSCNEKEIGKKDKSDKASALPEIEENSGVLGQEEDVNKDAETGALRIEVEAFS